MTSTTYEVEDKPCDGALRLAGGFRASVVRAATTPSGSVAALILATFLARLLLAGCTGLGIDESYMAATSRSLQLSYYDHPPIAWWLTWAAERLAGPGANMWIRLPFVVLFVLSSWLMFRLSSALYGERAALWATMLFNAVPVLGITAGTWVLPDGPLIAALLGAILCLVHALADSRRAWRWWLGCGACFGIALCSKYTAGPILLGAGLYLATEPSARRWLRRPQPYVAAALACAALAPVIVWNLRHHWVSFLFQGGRAAGRHWRPAGPFATLGGEALFFLPWIFAPLLLLLWHAVRRGPRDPRGWLIGCLSVPSFLLFEIVSLHAHVLFHWVAPALMLALPLLGEAVVGLRASSRRIRAALIGTVCVVLAGVMLIASEVRYNWMPEAGEDFALGKDPDVAAMDWSTLREELDRRGLAGPGRVIAATSWLDAGKIDYALLGESPVICLGNDPREYGVIRPASSFDGSDVIIVAPKDTLASLSAKFADQFERIEAIRPVMLLHAGKPAMLLPLFVGRNMHEAR